MKTGLIMEGGAMRGLFTAGVIDVFMEQGITFDGGIGVSAGATFGSNYKSRQPGRVLRYNLKFCQDPRYGTFRSLLKSGDLFETKFCYYDMPYELDKVDSAAFDSNPMEFYVVATDVNTGKAVYRRLDKIDDTAMDWFRASASMPMVSKIVEVEGLQLLDGGIADSVPVKYFESIGYDRNVVILTQPKGYQKTENKLLPLMKLSLRKYPKVLEAIKNRHLVYNETSAYIEEQEKAGKLLVIRPKEKLPIGRMSHDKGELQQVYDLGREAGNAYAEQVKRFLEK
ncbi:MAG: patatin family protein [Lachnospiraceae bacterium]|nr:patatin family protein [Lachnospiraceae bacterium]